MAEFHQLGQLEVPRIVSLQREHGPHEPLERARAAGFSHHRYRRAWYLLLTAVETPGTPYATGIAQN